MSLLGKYSAQEIEDKWYAYWMEHKLFKSQPDEREPYTIVMPPPNVTGVLHMGHMLNNTIQDVLIRRARMLGKNACWVPGTDHASIATEAKVVNMLKQQGIEKKDLTREQFLQYAWDWKEKYGGIILEQLKKLGASADWDRTAFTLDEALSQSVTDTFIHLYNKGYIYRGIRMVNWDPAGKTALSDEEVIRREVTQKLVYIRYTLEEGAEGDNPQYITIATTRPETIMADTAICVHPEDARYKTLIGKKAFIPLINRAIPFIADEYIDMEFGTGCLKVTPAHSLADYELAVKHNLPSIDILNDDGTLNELAVILVGEDRFAARKQIINMLGEAGHLVKTEENISQLGFSERTDAAIEPRLSLQWFVKMEELVKPALNDVLTGQVNLIPDKFTNTYRHWMDNVKDWCISRQLWWGQRIPAWYDDEGNWAVAKTKDEALDKLVAIRAKHGNYNAGALHQMKVQLQQVVTQDEDVVDTWFSSWLWPITVFNGLSNPDNADFKYYYPTNDLVTAPEILFFWVARMIVAGHELTGKKPFENVYLTGIVRDKLGRKMSKSLGNSPDPLQLIEKYGADGVRMGMLLSSPAGNDLMFDESYCEQGRNFANKIWNAFNLINGWQVDESLPYANHTAIVWFQNKFAQSLKSIEKDFDSYRLSDALMGIYKLIWDDFCSFYLELVKPAYQHPVDRGTMEATKDLFEKMLALLHPFMPFVTEELWHAPLFGTRSVNECCMLASYPRSHSADADVIKQATFAQHIIAEIRNLRNQKQLSPRVTLTVYANNNALDFITTWQSYIVKLANVSFAALPDSVSGTPILVGGHNYYVQLADFIDKDAERARLQKDLEHQHRFLSSVMAKLGNERFMANAKADVIAIEQKKKADAEAKIAQLSSQLNQLN